MADSTEVRALLLQISANTELLKSNLSAAERAVKSFHDSTQQHLSDTDKRFEAFGRSLEKPLDSLKHLGELAIAATIGESLKEAGERALEFAGNIEFVAKQIGVSTDFLQKFRYAAGQFGVGTEEAQTGLGRFTRSIGKAADGNKQAIGTFDQLGVKVRDSAGNVRSTEAVFNDVAEAIKRLDNPAQRVSATMTLFGRGAIGLVPLLAEGAAGFSGLAAAAQQLGIVLSPELIEHSEQVNHKLAALKEIMSAQLASAVAQNAEAIGNLATEVIRLAGGLAQLAGQHPEIVEALVGAAVGGRIGGLPGALALGAAGYVHGGIQKQQAIEQTTDPNVALGELNDARARLQRLSARAQFQGSFGGSVMTLLGSLGSAEGGPTAKEDGVTFVSNDALQSARRDVAFWQQRYATALKTRPPASALGSGAAGATNDSGKALADAQADIANLEKAKASASGAGLTAINQEIAERKREVAFIKSGVSAEMAKTLASKEGSAITKGENDARRLREKALQDDITYHQQDLALRKKLIEGAAKTAANDDKRVELQKEIIDAEADTLKAEIETRRDKGAYSTDPKVNAARAKDLLQLNEKVRDQDKANAVLAEQQKVTDEALALSQLQLQGQIDLKGLDERLATTREARLKLDLELLDLQEEHVKKEQQAIIDEYNAHAAQNLPGKYDKAAADQAQERINQIDAQHPANVELTKRQNASPLAAYGQSLREAVGSSAAIKDNLESIEVHAISGLTDELSGAVAQALHLKGIFGEIAAELIKMEIEKAVIGPFASFLGLSDGSVPGHADGVIPGFADGIIRGPGTGRSDSILAMMEGKGLIRVSNGESIINAESTRRYRPLLKLINDRKLPGFADGLVDLSGISLPRVTREDMRDIAEQRRGGITVNVPVDARGSTNPAEVKRIAQQAVFEAAPVIIAAAQGRTTSALTRPRLPQSTG